MAKKIYLARLGCAKNQIDGELMLGRAAAEGYEIVEDPQLADVLVVNTCGFIDAAREESVDAILAMARAKAEREDTKLVVTGCMAERYTAELAEEIPEVDAFVGTGSIDRQDRYRDRRFRIREGLRRLRSRLFVLRDPRHSRSSRIPQC